jgi:diacylglycerol O-acyltransferase / wax synthase
VDPAEAAVERLTVREAGYLRLEAAGVPHSIGWGAVLDHPVADAEQAFASLARQLEGRLHDLARLRQRVVILPRGFGLPIWVDDADFDLARHIHRAQADGPICAVSWSGFSRSPSICRVRCGICGS